jgi:signal transduction histidine kinase
MEYFMNKEKTINQKVKYEYEQIWQFTDYTLLICDEDESSWWVFNCLTEKLKKYESLKLAKKAAEKIDWAFARKQKVLGQLSFIGVLLVILVIFAAVLILVLKKIWGSQKAASRIEHNKMIFDIQEKERAKISRDIHDSVVQDIRVLRLETENLVVDEASKTRQTKIEDLATDCIIKLRNICYNLTPAELASHSEGDSTQLELISIINSLVQQFSSRTHIPCVFKVEEGFEYPVLEKETTQNLFRVIQEALTNIEKHSYATQVSIFIKKSGNILFIYITDDGIGCNPDELKRRLKSKDHLGLKSMKDRMDLIGGSIEFFTGQNEGMEITIKLPLENA